MFEKCDDSFIKALVRLLQPQVLLCGDYAFKVYELGSTMYFIQNGSVQIVSDGEPQVIYCTLMQGSYFGERTRPKPKPTPKPNPIPNPNPIRNPNLQPQPQALSAKHQTQPPNPQPQALTPSPKPQTLGELAMLTSQRRTASARAHTDCILFYMTVEDFEEVIKNYPKYYDYILDKAHTDDLTN